MTEAAAQPNPQDIEEALKHASRLLDADPAEALARANGIAAKQPDPRVLRFVARAYRALHRHDDAADAELSAIKLGFTAELGRAVAARESGKFADSKRIADEYLLGNPDDLLAKTIAAEAVLNLGQAELAETMLRQVLTRAPTFLRAAMLLAGLLASQVRLRDAIEIIEKLAARQPNDLTVLRYLASLRAQVGDYDAATTHYQKIATAVPESFDDLIKLAQNLRAAGRRAESVAAFRRAIDLAPQGGAAWWALAQYYPDELTDADIDGINRAVVGAKQGTENSGLLRIALSIIHDRRGEAETAFREISEVKASRRQAAPYDPDVLSRHIDELIEGFTPGLFASSHPDGVTGPGLVFIVGMPRSGSTLVERILGRHSKIETTGELQVMPRLVAAEETVLSTRFNSLPPAFLSDAKQADLARLYLARSRDFRRTDKPIFIDKYNANWIHAGLIRLVFPHAKIIDVRRDPVDCCWSVFRMMFGDPYANDQRHLARYFADYARFMKAIDNAAPGGILSVRYEALVDNVESETRRLLSFVGVDWEPQCIDFHLSDQPVATPSSEQVRRPLFRQGIGSAAPYRKWLAPLVEELESLSMLPGAR